MIEAISAMSIHMLLHSLRGRPNLECGKLGIVEHEGPAVWDERPPQLVGRRRRQQTLRPLGVIRRWRRDLQDVTDQELEAQLHRRVPSLHRDDRIMLEVVADIEGRALERRP